VRQQYATLAVVFLFVLSLPAAAAIRLYLKDGTYQEVREYQVTGDRVKFYSTERSEWEEIPLSLADIAKTEAEQAKRKAEISAEVKSQDSEEKAERALRREADKIPQTPGAYFIRDGTVVAIPQGQSKVIADKKRSVLKALSPVPINGKATLEMAGEHAPTVITNNEPEFYLRLDQPERFGIIRLRPRKGMRIAEKLTVLPVADVTLEDPSLVDVVRQQVGDGLYKISPMKALEPGEYAVVEYTADELDMQIWDFSCAATGTARDASVKQ
jgi:hypothetical protein